MKGIAFISNTVYRRSVIVLATLPTFAALLFCNLVLGLITTLQEVEGLVRTAWRGRSW